MTTDKLIFSPQLATKLLKRGFTIVDLKADREDPKQTIFVFRVSDGFYEAIEEYKNNIVK